MEFNLIGLVECGKGEERWKGRVINMYMCVILFLKLEIC